MRIANAIRLIEKIHRVAQKIPLRFENAVPLSRLGFLPEHFLVRLVQDGHHLQIGRQRRPVRDRVNRQPPVMQGLQQRLVNDPAQGDQVIRLHLAGIFIRIIQPQPAPINGVRLGQTPVQRAILFIHRLRKFGVNFVPVPEHQCIRPFRRRDRVEQSCEIGSPRAEKRHHFLRPAGLVIHVCIVQVRPHLVLKEPGKFTVNQYVVFVVFQAVIAQQFNAVFHPAPAVGGILKFHRNVVGHVPTLKQPDLRERGLQLRDPVRQLCRLEKLVVLLQIIGANPEKIGNNAAKAAERNRGERQHRRCIFQHGITSEPQGVSILVQPSLHAPGGK